MQGYEALRGAAAWRDTSARGRILLSGADRARLLHAMSTNHVEQLGPGQGCYAFFLNAQGRVLADAGLWNLGERLLISVEPEVREKIYAHLDRYIIADDVTLEDAGGATCEIALDGPGAAAALATLGAPVPEGAWQAAAWGARWVLRERVWRIVAPAADLSAITAGIAVADGEAAHAVRLERGEPRYGEDITEANIAQETGLLTALHFSKGCYIGQEIVERVRARGHVNRRLAHLRIAAAAAPAPGTPLLAGEKEAGAVTSAAWSPADGVVYALGYVRAEHAAPGTALTAGGHAATILAR